MRYLIQEFPLRLSLFTQTAAQNVRFGIPAQQACGPTPVILLRVLRMAASVVAAAATALGGLVAAGSGPNVRGTLDRTGAETPACYPDEPCDPTPVGVYVVFFRSGHPAVRVRVRSSGSFAVRLAPAWYRIRLAPPPLSGHVTPARVRVPREGVVRLRLEIQS